MFSLSTRFSCCLLPHWGVLHLQRWCGLTISKLQVSTPHGSTHSPLVILLPFCPVTSLSSVTELPIPSLSMCSPYQIFLHPRAFSALGPLFTCLVSSHVLVSVSRFCITFLSHDGKFCTFFF